MIIMFIIFDIALTPARQNVWLDGTGGAMAWARISVHESDSNGNYLPSTLHTSLPIVVVGPQLWSLSPV